MNKSGVIEEEDFNLVIRVYSQELYDQNPNVNIVSDKNVVNGDNICLDDEKTDYF